MKKINTSSIIKQKPPKTIGTNSMTEHSKKLRRKTSDDWKKKNILSKAIKYNKNLKEDMDLLAKFESIEASSNKQRMLILIDSYFKKEEI